MPRFCGCQRFLTQRTFANILDAGCGLIGIIAAQLGGKIIFTNPADLVPILKSNIATNCPDAEHEIMEYAWYAFTSSPLIPCLSSLENLLTFNFPTFTTILVTIC